MKEVYTNTASAGRDFGIEPKVIQFMMRKGVWDIGYIEEPGKSRKQRRYFIFGRKLCKELGREFVPEGRESTCGGK